MNKPTKNIINFLINLAIFVTFPIWIIPHFLWVMFTETIWDFAGDILDAFNTDWIK